jgi:hypothetical protein
MKLPAVTAAVRLAGRGWPCDMVDHNVVAIFERIRGFLDPLTGSPEFDPECLRSMLKYGLC